MSGRDDLSAAGEAIMARKRKELGDPPTPEELLAYRDGRLDPVARERLESKVAVHPDAARALADLAAFPDVEPGPGVPDLFDKDVDAGWNAFRGRLETLPRPEPASVRSISARSTWSPTLLAAAAVLLLSVGLGGYLAGRASRTAPQPAGPSRNVQIAELQPVTGDVFRAPEAPLELPESSEALVLILALPGTKEFTRYEAEIRDQDGRILWSGGGLNPNPLGNVQMSFPRSAFTPGVYRIDLFGLDEAGKRRKVAGYELRVALTPGPSPASGRGVKSNCCLSGATVFAVLPSPACGRGGRG